MATAKAARGNGSTAGNTVPRRRRRHRSIVGALAYWAVVTTVWTAVAAAVAVGYFAYDLPDTSRLVGEGRAPGITVTASDGLVLATSGNVYAAHVDQSELSPALIDAVVAIEDRRFFDHMGVDPWGIVRAALSNLRAGRVIQGGSTITQQIAKNVFLTPDRTIHRKIQEVLLALWLERRFTKPQLLTIYLNRVYLGAGSYGFEAAARRYFGKSARRLSLAEAAMLAGLPKAPSRYAPTRDLVAARARAAVVLDAMVATGRLDASAAAAAKSAPAAPVGAYMGGGGARYFADWVIDQLADYVGPPTQDLVIATTLDPAAQAAAEHAVASLFADRAAAEHIGEAALIAMSPDGAVRAMVGGRSYGASQFNRAVQARRQPGSAFKIAVYAAAIEAGAQPSDIVSDAPIAIDGWRPRNYDSVYRGDITLGEAFAYSSNSVAVQLARRVGLRAVAKTARRLGITTMLKPAPSLALGAGEVTLVDLTGAYAVVANGGHGVIPYGIAEVRDRDGRLLYRRAGSGPGRVLDDRVVRHLADMMAAVVRYGTGKRAQLDVPSAGKTGTSQDFRDAWFVGFRSDLVAGVWLGNDDSAPMREVTGGGSPARLWHDFMTRYAP